MGTNRMGERIHVYWVDEMAWFSGVVQRFSVSQGFYVVYDDGDERWEGPDVSYRFDGQQDSDEEDEQEEKDGGEIEARGGGGQEEGEKRDAVRGATPRMMEPPGTDDDEEGGEGSDNEAPEFRTNAAEVDIHAHVHDATSLSADEDNVAANDPAAYPQPVVLASGEEDPASENEDDARSVALSDVPTTYEPTQQPPPRGLSMRSLPPRGILRGMVVSATQLPRVNRKEEPRAFVRIAFVEGGGGSQSSALMLRCKQALAATQPTAVATSHPLWNDADDGDAAGVWSDADRIDGLFQLQVVPPMLSTSGAQQQQQPAWLQLNGDLLFSVYHEASEADSQRNEFIGQASVPLSRLMREILSSSSASPPCRTATQHLPLETRQGKPLGPSGEIALAVVFQFEPEFRRDLRRAKATTEKKSETRVAAALAAWTTPRTSSSAASVASSRPSARPKSATLTASAKRVAAAAAAHHHHQSSSEVNRRRFEKQLDAENKAMAKRVAEQRRESGALAARRQRLNHQPPLKSEPKAAAVVVAEPRRLHKASSQINRAKFVDQVQRENKSMGKRLVERAGLAKWTGRGAGAKSEDEALDWADDRAQDKAHVADRRAVLRQEKDSLLEKAQAKYQRQSELVEEVMALQTEVSEWKQRLFTVKSSLQRVGAMNAKDTHVRDCLRRAAAKSKRLPPSACGDASSTARLQQLLGIGDDDGGDDEDEGDACGDPIVAKCRNKLRELLRDASSLEGEKLQLEAHARELDKQETALEGEVLDLHRRWHFVQTKRAFQTRMAEERATPARAAYAASEWRAKTQAMELTPEEEEQHAIVQAQEELTQLQIAVTVLRDRVDKCEVAPAAGVGGRPGTASSSSSSAACEYLREKIEKRRAKLAKLEAQQREWRRQYEALVVGGEHDRLRAHTQELRHLLFLCQSEAKHVAAAERIARHSKETAARALDTQRFHEQTETEILLKKKERQNRPPAATAVTSARPSR